MPVSIVYHGFDSLHTINSARSKPPLLAHCRGEVQSSIKKTSLYPATSLHFYIPKPHTFCAQTSAIFSPYNIVKADMPVALKIFF